MKILVCGMPRSMTTWAFNVIRELVAAPQARLLWIEPASSDEAVFAQEIGVVIGKCHHFSPTLAEAADIVVYSYRDLRTAAVSAYRKFGATGSREQLDTWIAVERLWLLHADLVLRYEDVEADPRAGLRQIADLLASRGIAIARESGEAILSRVDAAFSRREKASGPGFDAETLILAGHRTFQPAVDSLPDEERAMYMRVEEQFAGWLRSHGYLHDAAAPEPEAAGDPLGAYLAALMRDIESKQAEIGRLHAATTELETVIREQGAALEERDAVIRDQGEALTGRDDVIRDQEAALTGRDDVIRDQEAALTGRDQVIRAQEAALTDLRLAVLTQGRPQPASEGGMPAERQAELLKLLQDKEAVIREHATALKETRRALLGYRGAFVLFSVALVPLNFAASRLRRIFLGGRRLIAPRLGVLVQHEPRALRFPPASPPSVARTVWPKISLVTPSYNQAQFIERTVRSVVDQEYPNLEYRVQDGGSTDGTVEILRRCAGRLAGWDSRPDKGQSEAINRGFAGTTGEIMAWLNSDDVLFPGALEYVADYFASHPDVDAIYGHRILIDEEDRQIGRWILPAHSDRVLSWADFVPQETLFWRRRIWDKAGGRVDESFRFAMDWDLLLRFREAGARFRRVPRFLGGFRIHSRQKTSAAISDVGFQEMNRLRERVLGRVPSGAEVRKALVPYVLRHLAADVPWKIRDGLTTVGARA